MNLARLALTFSVGLLASTALGTSGFASDASSANNYGDRASWLCLPGRADACTIDNTTSLVAADGSIRRETWKAARKPSIDCFYVYPTVSTDPGIISDMSIDPAERRVVEQQLSRLASKCRVFAPMYRQFTLTALRAMTAGTPMPGSLDPSARERGYQDVKDAWNWYLAHENKGRGVVLLGHSQGSGVLTRLVAAEVEGSPAQARMLSAILMGTNLPVPEGKDVGGAFKSTPLCKSAGQIGCAIAYVSFSDTAPPPANSRFGKPREPVLGVEAACTNPASLSGGKGELKAYLSGKALVSSGAGTTPTWSSKASVDTPFVSLPGLISGECVRKNGFSYLEVHVNADPADARTDVIGGEVVAGGQAQADWGLHLIDVNLAMGNLLDILDAQTATWKAAKK